MLVTIPASYADCCKFTNLFWNGSLDQSVEGRIDRKANINGTARIMGGSGVRDWFQAHFSVMDQADVELGFPEVSHSRKAE